MGTDDDKSRLDRQADALDRHELLIARHTAIQSWTNVLSLLVTVITTIALGYIAVIQYRTSERQVALEYARSANRYAASVDYLTEDGRPQTEDTLGQPAIPHDLKVRRTIGDSTIQNIFVWQEIVLSTERDVSPHGLFRPSGKECRIVVTNWFLPRSGIDEDLRLNPRAKAAFSSIDFAAPNGEKWVMSAGPTYVFISSADVFGKDVDELLTVEGDTYSVGRLTDAADGQLLDGNPLRLGIPASIVPGKTLSFSYNRLREQLGDCEGLLSDVAAGPGE